MADIKRLLIANRGEIACRIIRTAKAMGIETTALYSDPDYQSQHVQLADQALHIGPATPTESYLNIPKVLQAAQDCRADAIHPGYGFLSENTDFAEACQKQGLIFIGPSPEAIEAMGSKSQAKILMAKAGVPMVPGYHGDDQSNARLIKEAKNTGYPLLIKAAYGGGGKGMRVVHHQSELEQALNSARREALSAFGNERLLLERFITQARHVEVQIFFDQQGQGIYLFDRDCSLQRRHQKIIEEAPAPGLSSTLRKAMGEAAVAAGQAIDYQGAGTIEFLLEGEDFYFMEMNTRLQVEHPVTEMVSGVDLVRWQIQVAQGENLPLQQDELVCQGHAVEARIYAEDPYRDFLPSSGRVLHLSWPAAHNGLRIDAGIQAGDCINSYYDPMIAKMIAFGKTREAAINRLTEGLGLYHQGGVTDNRDHLLYLLQQPGFYQASMNTHFVEQHSFALSEIQQRQLLTVATLYLLHINQCTDQSNFFAENSHWQMNTQFVLYINEQAIPISAKAIGDHYQLHFPNGHCQASAQWQSTNGQASGSLQIAGNKLACQILPLPRQRIKVILPDCSYELGLPGHGQGKHRSAQDGLIAPMNGRISQIMVKEQESVQQGTPLLVVEAMKMEHCIKAPEAGVIEQILFQAGDPVEAGTTLLTFREECHEA